MSYDALVIAAHPDDAATQMGGTLARLSDAGQRILLIDLTDGEPSEFAEPGVRAEQAAQAAHILGVERRTLGLRDRLLQDTPEARLELARLIRQHQPRWVYGTGEACVHPDHVAAVSLTRAAVFLARLGQWDRVPGGELLANQEPWIVERLLGAYTSIFASGEDHLLSLYEAEDQYHGRLVGVRYAEVLRSAAPLLVADPTVFRPLPQG